MTPVEEMKALAGRWAQQIFGERLLTVGEPVAEMKTDDNWQTATVIVTIPITPRDA